MSSAPLLDTHAWVWWIRRDERLGSAAIEQLDAFRPGERPSVADISLWEIAMLVRLGRLELGAPLRTWLDVASHPRTVRIMPISAAIAAETAALPQTLRDPADRIIVATSRVADVPLLTHDRAILRSRLAHRWKAA
jgi:PIN domain nuclease of toxin-antitoxin system